MDEIKEACAGKLTPDEVEEALKDLVELGVVFDDINPQTKEKEFKFDEN